MSKETIDQVIRFLEKSNIHTLDLTGVVPEMNPHFKYLVSVARKMDIKIID